MPDIPEYNYDQQGLCYHTGRRTEPRIAAQIWRHLKLDQSILNIGAGTGSYEPPGADLIPLEPSRVMLEQRTAPSARLIQAGAEQLPLPDKSVDQVMTILSIHHWSDPVSAFEEIRRVCRHRFVALTWDPAATPFWLTRDYFPQMHAMDKALFMTMDTLRKSFPGLTVENVPIPRDCQDGFLAAYWCRPQAYLDPAVRACISSFGRLECIEDNLAQLADDLRNGRWQRRNANLLTRSSLDAGYRLIRADIC